MIASTYSADIQEFLLLYQYEVEYMIVGGEAVIYHGHARLTGDIDFFYRLNEENAAKLFKVLQKFWDNAIPGITTLDELMEKGTVMQFGVPPNRIDLLNEISGVEFEQAWQNRVQEEVNIKGNQALIYYIGLEELKQNKKAIKRAKDEDDLRYL